MESIADNIKIDKALNANVVNNDTDGTSVGIRTRDYVQNAFWVFIGISGDTLSGTVKLIPTLQESLDSTNGSDGAWTAVAAADIKVTTFAMVDDPAEDDVQQYAEYQGDAPWIRVLIDTTGTHTVGTPITVVSVQTTGRNLPPA